MQIFLGSASRELIRQSSESLAGRIAYFILGGFTLADIGIENLKKLWLAGSFPRAYFAKNPEESFIWLDNYISAFLERDIPQLGITIPSGTLKKFWVMLSHYHGQIVNYSELGRSFGISDVTVRKYIDLLEGTFMLRILQPWYINTKKRLVKRPKIYLRDSGLFHALMSIRTMDQLLSHNKSGSSWEGFALECITRCLNKKDGELYSRGTHTGTEIDLFLQEQGKNWGIEFKYADAPKKTKSMQIAVDDLQLSHLWIIYPGIESYKLDKTITVFPLKNIPETWKYP